MNTSIKTALRGIKKHKGYSFINIFGLALGLACCIMIVMWIRDERTFDRFHKNFDNIYRIVADWPKNGWEGVDATPQPLGPLVVEQIPEVLEMVRFASHNRLVFRYKDRAFYESRGLIADPSLFRIFTFEFLEGSAETAFTSPSDLVITESLAHKYFGEEDPLGKTVQVEGRPATVTGVIADIPQNSTLRFDFMSSFEFIKELANYGLHWGAFNFNSFVLLHPEANPKDVGPKITSLALEYNCPQVKDGASFRLQPLSAVHLDARPYKREMVSLGDKKALFLFSMIAAFILLISCVNYVNLATARSSLRAKEVGLRKTVGAGRFQIVRQFLGESFILTGLAFISALALILLFSPLYSRLSEKPLTLLPDDPGQILLLAGLFVLTGFLSGWYPALFLSGFPPIQNLRQQKQGGGGIFLRRILVVLQFSLTIVLLIGTVVVFRQLRYVSHADLGFNRDNIIQIPIKENLGARYQAFKEELLRQPRIQSVTAERYPFAEQTWRSAGNFDWEGREARDDLDMVYTGVDYDFFSTLEIEMVEGRVFSRDYASDENEAVILNQSAVEAMGIDNPVGKWFSVSKEDRRTIIGVVSDVLFRSLHFKTEPRLFYIADLSEAEDMGLILVKIEPGPTEEVLQEIRNIWISFNPISPFEYHFLDDTYAALYQKEKRMLILLNVFTGFAVFISCLGLLGLAAFMAERRTKEIGIRKILGAGESGIVLNLTKEFIRWVLLANIVAWPLGYFLGNTLLREFSVKKGMVISIFVFSGALTLLAAALTVGFQALRAARANPADSLRYE
jgi:putative ABC transport system permease protein